MRKAIRIMAMALSVALGVLLSGCSSTRYVPSGSYLLENVKINVNDSTDTFSSGELMTYIHQRPNNRFLNLTKLRLGIFNMSGKDSTKWWNKWIRKLGEPPALYSEETALSDSIQLLRVMNNAGFLDATVKMDSFPDKRKKKMHLIYDVTAGSPHTVRSISYEFPNDTLHRLIMRDSARFDLHPGDRLDRNDLEELRSYITTRLRNRGYWGFSKEFITFNADTTEGSKEVDLTMIVHPPYPEETAHVEIDTHRKYMIGNVYFLLAQRDSTIDNPRRFQAKDTVNYKGIHILYAGDHYLRPSVLYESTFLRPGAEYRERDVNNTYNALGRLSILRFSQIRLVPAGNIGDIGLLNAYIMLSPTRSQSISLEVEGTNSEGDLGVALGVNYTHRNIGKGSETLNVKLRGSYQALNGNLEGFIHNRFMEYSVEGAVTFPKFKAPLLRESFKRRIKASTELHLSLNYQERPEYTRIIAAAGWSYKWTERLQRRRYVFTPIDINYVYLPQSTNDFIDQIAPDNPLLRYSYEDHFIMRFGFNFYFTNKRPASSWHHSIQKDIVNVRVAAETAGNLLFLLSSIFDHRKNFHTDPYKVLGIRYSQYVRADADFSYLHSFDRRNALACYAGFGIGVPYGNSSILPFEKRFYGGGANGVRGWDVRTLGPGRFPGSNSVKDFIYQCGDIRLNLSVEYRAKLFWVVEGALFIDAGNIWTIRNYETQPYGKFCFNNFYKELAAAYGVGIRLDFSYFLIRFDMGMKAHNPAMGEEPWPLIHPKWGRDHSFHFSIGYPF